MTNKYLMVGAVVAGLGLVYLVKKGADAVPGLVKEGAQALNPLNNDNIINQGATSAYQWLTDSTGSIGTDIYDALHKQVAANELAWWQYTPPGAMASAVGLTSDDKGQPVYDIQKNWINRGVNAVGSTVTGKESWSLGTALYDLFNGD